MVFLPYLLKWCIIVPTNLCILSIYLRRKLNLSFKMIYATFWKIEEILNFYRIFYGVFYLIFWNDPWQDMVWTKFHLIKLVRKIFFFLFSTLSFKMMRAFQTSLVYNEIHFALSPKMMHGDVGSGTLYRSHFWKLYLKGIAFFEQIMIHYIRNRSHFWKKNLRNVALFGLEN